MILLTDYFRLYTILDPKSQLLIILAPYQYHIEVHVLKIFTDYDTSSTAHKLKEFFALTIEIYSATNDVTFTIFLNRD